MFGIYITFNTLKTLVTIILRNDNEIDTFIFITDFKLLIYSTIWHNYQLVLWLYAKFRTGYRKRNFSEKTGAFDLLNIKT